MNNDFISETVVTTVSAASGGVVHVAPMGLRIFDGDHVLMPFRPSTTLDNMLATRSAVVNFTADVRVFAGCVTGRRDWPTLPVHAVPGARLAATLSHAELQLERVDDDPQRPVLHFRCVQRVTHAPFAGFNRAQAAVIEGAVLVSRLRMLASEKVDAEMNYLQIAIDKTAGPAELQAWAWLREAVVRHRADAAMAAAPGRAP